MQAQCILIVEDEDVTRFHIKKLFEAEGYHVLEATSGSEMDDLFRTNTIDLVIMDINLPGKNGLLLGREISQKPDLGLIFLSSRDDDIDKILGLEMGADDYLTKPFNPRELTIRVRNTLSRISQQTISSHDDTIKFNGWVLHKHSRKMTSPNNEEKAISRGEYRALTLLIRNSGKIISRQELINEMTGRDLRKNDRTVDVTIRRLRKHFEYKENSPELINTIHGEGYRFVGQVDS